MKYEMQTPQKEATLKQKQLIIEKPLTNAKLSYMESGCTVNKIMS